MIGMMIRSRQIVPAGREHRELSNSRIALPSYPHEFPVFRGCVRGGVNPQVILIGLKLHGYPLE